MQRVADIAKDVEIVARQVIGQCSAGIKEGDRVVIRGANIVKEESGPICGYAFAGIYPVVFAVRLGADLEGLGIQGRLWQCVDPGPPHTPGGTVLFEVRPLDPLAKGGK